MGLSASGGRSRFEEQTHPMARRWLALALLLPASALRCDTGPKPSPPARVACAAAVGAISVTVEAAGDDADYASIELFRGDETLPRVHYTTPFGAAAAVPADGPYRVAARAHLRGCAEDGGNYTFSTLTFAAAPCAPASGRGARASDSSTYREMLRMTEWGRTLPDFLDNHDAGDRGGLGVTTSLFVGVGNATEARRRGLPLRRSPVGSSLSSDLWTRYCVEIEAAVVENTTTTTFRGAPAPSPFSDYRSTNPLWSMRDMLGWMTWLPRPAKNWEHMLAAFVETPGAEYASACVVSTDRYIGQLSRGNILAADCATDMFSDRYMLCDCSDASAAASLARVGMMPIGTPLYDLPLIPGVYPDANASAEPAGHWFSFPAGGRCARGAAIGDDGCTWQRSPLAHSFHLSDLLAAGFNQSAEKWVFDSPIGPVYFPNAHQPLEKTLQNAAAFSRVVAALPPCG